MPITYGYYNSVNGDRKYDAKTFSRFFNLFLHQGTFKDFGEQFSVKPAGGMSVRIGTGGAWSNTTWTISDTAFNIALNGADPTFPRHDLIVVRSKAGDGDRRNEIIKLTGKPESAPKDPGMSKSVDTYDLPIARIRVKAGTTSISATDITSLVGTSDNPWVTGPGSHFDTDAYFNEMQSSFDDWFKDVKETLSNTPVGDLKVQLDILDAEVKGLLFDTGIFDLSPIQGIEYFKNIRKGKLTSNGLYANVTFRFKSVPTNGNTKATDIPIAIFPPFAVAYLENLGFTDQRTPVGNFSFGGNSGVSGVVVADTSQLYLSYRTGTIPTNEWGRLGVAGAIGWSGDA